MFRSTKNMFDIRKTMFDLVYTYSKQVKYLISSPNSYFSPCTIHNFFNTDKLRSVLTHESLCLIDGCNNIIIIDLFEFWLNINNEWESWITVAQNLLKISCHCLNLLLTSFDKQEIYYSPFCREFFSSTILQSKYDQKNRKLSLSPSRVMLNLLLSFSKYSFFQYFPLSFHFQRAFSCRNLRRKNMVKTLICASFSDYLTMLIRRFYIR